MRYDLEFNVTSKVTQDGLNLLSETLYGESNIVAATWDTNSIVSQFGLNVGQVDFSRYNKKKYIADSFIVSGVDLTTSNLLSVSSILNRDFITPIFNGGSYTSNRGSFLWSKNAIVKPCEFKDGYYQCEIDPGVDTSKIIVQTLEYDSVSFYKTKKTFYFLSYIKDTEKTLEENLTATFKSSTSDYKFTVVDDVIYLNISKISFIAEKMEKLGHFFLLPEFPATELTVTGTDKSFKEESGLLIFDEEITDDLFATYDVVPLVSFIGTVRSNEDLVFSNLNMHPRLLNYKNGTLCIRPNFSSVDIPKSLIITSNKSVLFGSESARITTRLVGAGDIALANKDVSLKITTNNATFVSSANADKSTIDLQTYIDGEVTTDIIANTDKVGFYLQKEWAVSSTQIIVPFKISENLDTQNIYLYMITADDPFLGKVSVIGGETKFEEYFTGDQISSLEMSGRKIAYVKLKDNEGTLVSRFIKPTSATLLDNAVAVTKQNLTFKNLIYNKSSNGNQLVDTVLNKATYGSGHWEFEIPGEYTVLTYDKIPRDANIVGYWLITDSLVNIEATYTDSVTSLKSDTISISLQNLRSENSFNLNKYSSSSNKTQYGTFGYYTMSEYFKNPFGLNAFSFYCMHSDCVYKKCLNPDLSLHKNFILDDGRVGCARTDDYETANNGTGTANVGFCKGLDAHLVNPFIMHTEVQP